MKKLFFVLASCLTVSSVFAGGYRVSTQGQRALAMGHTGVAVVNSAELAFFNPAGLVFLENKLNISAGVTGIMSTTKFQNLDDRQTFTTDSPISTPINLYATYKITDNFSAGLAVYTPYGSSVEWPDNWAGAGLVNNIQLQAIFINPVLSFKINDGLSIGGGPIYVIGGVNFNRNIEVTSGAESINGPSSIEVDAQGVTAWGWKGSLLFRPSEKLDIGFSYQSKIDINAKDGDVTFTNAPQIPTKFNSSLPLPAELTFGLSYKFTDKLLVALDFNRAYWNVYESLDLDFTNPAAPDSTNPRNYKDANTYRIGAQYDVNDKITVRAGYYFDETPVSSGFFSPETPRNDSNGFTTGLSYNISEKLAVDASFLFLHFSEVDESYDASPNDNIIPLGFIACEPEFDQDLADTPIAAQESGEADFSKFVSIGNSLTAGFSDGALYREGQENAFANILANQMKPAGGGDFITPFMTDNNGGFRGVEAQFGTRFVLEIDSDGNRSPVRLSPTANNDITARVTGPINNFGVPGAKSYHLGFSGYAGLNPYYGRFASAADATVIGDVATAQPTFFTMWIGNNDALSYATSGGVVLDAQGNPVIEADGSQREATSQVGNIDASTYTQQDISDPNLVAGAIKGYTDLLTAMGTNNTKGVVVNVPDVTSIPFFTTVPNNALVLDATQAAGLTGFFQLYANIVSGGIQMTGVPKEQADLLASQYAIKFNPGPNRFIIKVPVDPSNPSGIRQMTENELLLLTIDQGALRTQGYGSAAITPEIAQILGAIAAGGPAAFNPADAPKILAALNPIEDKDALDNTELSALSTAVTSFNAGIKAVVDDNPNLVLYDANSRLTRLSDRGITSQGTSVTSTFGTGGAFSLDGIHLTPRGNAVIANELIKVINTNFNSTLQPVSPGNFKTITLK